ncbi:MAG: methylenetetrahydrofolate--tRNA-(uracil(54)-C(5))-methyltransferase (FADH(2)-oxidizing) TrmFO [Clostridiales bacterium]|nr:MAG: methylenetetrahydrofolate--tRNA-(uracil(54)-C(5))-methyltransferase (FADH(2)-oxidizing) TrmFO [Clostridiales bacterium]
MSDTVNIIGAGLAGCEAAYQLSRRGIAVRLYEMRPGKMTPAHTTDGFAELVCSNSLRSDRMENAVGLLKEEMRRLDSLVMAAADATKVPAGGALAVDRKKFSAYITAAIEDSPNVEIIRREITDLEMLTGKTIVATGPLTSDALADYLEKLTGEHLHFFDAAAPIVSADSIDMEKVFEYSRYGRGSDYLNCPLSQEEYLSFYRELVGAERALLHEFEKADIFEGCMPVEIMAGRGVDTLRFGPMKPVGLTDPRTGAEPYAVVQLRKEDEQGTMYNLVGFQTNLKIGEQKRVFGMIPGLERAEYLRYGAMHRNTFINSPRLLDGHYRLRDNEEIYFAGQMTGVEGYVESASSGLLAGLFAACDVLGREKPVFSDKTAIGALAKYVSNGSNTSFQPMNVNFGIMQPADKRFRKKADKNRYIASRALEEIEKAGNWR